MAKKNDTLHSAKTAKNDEFYTQITDIEQEISNYRKHFKDKIIYMPCDNPEWSNFWHILKNQYIYLHYKKIIATFYNGIVDTDKQPYKLEYDGVNETKTFLNGDGDFRSAECVELLKHSDIVVTNPPFSLFREFISQIVRNNKQFLVIGNVNAITYKEIFDLIQNNKAWLGINLGRGISGFIVPKQYEAYGNEVSINSDGQTIIATNGCLWLTNLQLKQRYEDIILTREYVGNEENYPTYDNCDGINVNRTQDIPKDYCGLMGVPITFLHKYNPNQFEIVKFRKGDDGKDLRIKGKCPYFRILIRHKRLEV